MRHRRLRRTLGIRTKHRMALMRNLARNLVIHKRIRTTYAKAKEASAFADTLVTIAKRGDLNARRLLISKLGNEQIAKMLLAQIAPLFKDRKGGYTRVLRLGYRPGDCAETALLEFTTIIEEPKKAKKPKKEKAKKETKGKEAAEVSKKEKPEKKPIDVEKEEPKKPVSEKEEKPAEEKKESEKKGGFLSKLRKFLKGDE